MGGTRSTLASVEGHLLESMGQRTQNRRPESGPTPLRKDIGRRPVSGYCRIDINQVVPDPEQPRTKFAQETVEQLAASIQERGQQVPIRVRWSEPLGKWVIIAGERRWRAARHAGLTTIDCHFREGDLSRSDVLTEQLIENLQREDLKPIEEARAFATLMELNAWNGAQVSEALRIPPSRVSRALALLRLPGDIQNQVEAGELAARSAYELSKLKDEQQQRQLADQAAAGQLTHGEAAQAVKRQRRPARKNPPGTRLTFLGHQDWSVVVTCKKRGTYHDVEVALKLALEEVQHRIDNNIQLF